MDSGTHGFFAIGGAGVLAAAYGISRLNLRDIFDISRDGGYWKVIALLFALFNLKSLPFAWHYRLLKGLLSHITLGRKCPKSPGPGALFQPLIVSSRTSLWETDYNGHKSNSTYFADLDIARMHLITCLLKTGLHRAHYEKPSSENEAIYGKSAGGGRLAVMLGGVSCHFRKEIKPYQAYEIWTRVLTWDRKWLYLVSHIVKKGAVIPRGYSQQSWRRPENSAVTERDGSKTVGEILPVRHPAIFASSVAKYVFKSGRITIPPELALTHGELLPSRPKRAEQVPEPSRESHSSEVDLGSPQVDDDGFTSIAMTPQAFTWEQIEAERLRGFRIAKHFADLDELDNQFTADKGEALGRW